MTPPAAVEIFGAALAPGPEFARTQDDRDPVAAFRDRFELPVDSAGASTVYFAGNSLGPMPLAARDAVARETERWSRLGVDGWFEEPEPWYRLDERFLPALARLVGGRTGEVAVMNGLTVNLHVLLASFFRPAGERRRILIDHPCFPSDRYAVETQLRWHGQDPDADIVEVGSDARAHGSIEDAIEEELRLRGPEIAVVLLAGVNFLTGHLLDIERLARAAHDAGAVVGLDLAHAVGNVPLRLHEWDVDFAAWCHYKYVNAGPGAPAGVFVHERHASGADLPRLGGWWGNDPETRFRIQLQPDFRPRDSALGWQLSCPSALAMAPLGPALDLFDEAGIGPLREKSMRLTAYLEWLLVREPDPGLEVITPRDPARRGAQLSLRVDEGAGLQAALQEAGIVGDYREPNVVRLAPAPLFNTYHEVWRAAEALRGVRGAVA